jgi:hypothetical protein
MAELYPDKGDSMTQLPVSFSELVELLKACGPIHAADCTLQEVRALLVAQLGITDPALEKRVRTFRPDQMDALCEYILSGLKLASRA